MAPLISGMPSIQQVARVGLLVTVVTWSPDVFDFNWNGGIQQEISPEGGSFKKMTGGNIGRLSRRMIGDKCQTPSLKNNDGLYSLYVM